MEQRNQNAKDAKIYLQKNVLKMLLNITSKKTMPLINGFKNFTSETFVKKRYKHSTFI